MTAPFPLTTFDLPGQAGGTSSRYLLRLDLVVEGLFRRKTDRSLLDPSLALLTHSFSPPLNECVHSIYTTE